MISQSLFLELGLKASTSRGVEPNNREEMIQFIRPHVFVLHQPSRVGFYLSADLRHIISVDRCREPENPVQVQREHLPPGFSCPPWILEIALPKGECAVNEFDTFWLY